METIAFLSLVAVVGLYAAATVVYFVEFFGKRGLSWPLGLALTIAGFLADTLFHLTRSHGEAAAIRPYTLAYTLSNIGWVMILVFLLGHIRWKIDKLGAFLVPLPLAFLLIALFLRPEASPLVIQSRGTVLTVHVITIILGQAAFGVVFVLSSLYLIVRRALKSKTMWFMDYPFPSLQTLDSASMSLLRIGFPLITIGIFTGSVLWSRVEMTSPILSQPFITKEVWAFFSWTVYATLLAMRSFFAMSPRRGAYLAIAGFLSIMLSWFGTDHLFEAGL